MGAVKSVVVIENVASAINQIAQITLRNVVGQHTLDQTLSEADAITPYPGDCRPPHHRVGRAADGRRTQGHRTP